MAHATKQRLLDAGLAMLLKHGYNDLGIQALLEATSVPKGSFYHHFRDKEAFALEVVDEYMRTGLPNVWAAGDGVVTHHRLLGVTYLPLGTTSHKQGRVAGENAIGGNARFAGSLGTQVVKVFDVVAVKFVHCFSDVYDAAASVLIASG